MMKKETVIVEQTYPVTVNRVWAALTNNEELKKWYFQLTEFNPVAGFKFEFSGGPEDGPQYLHICEITKVIENQKLTYSWRYDNYPGNTEVNWELFDQGKQTLVRLTHTGLETFPKDDPNFAASSFNGGWTYFLHTALKNYLEDNK